LQRSTRFHNAARALFSSYVAPPFSRRLVSPFSRSSVGQRTFSPAAFQRALCVCFGFLHVSRPCRDLSIHRMDGKTMRGPFLRVRMRRTGPRPRFRDTLKKKNREASMPRAERKSVFLSFSSIYFSCISRIHHVSLLFFAVDITVLNYENQQH